MRLLLSLVLAALLLSGCTLTGRTFSLMANSAWQIAPDGTAYAYEQRPGGVGIIYRINGDAVIEELRGASTSISIVGLIDSALVVRTGGEGGPLVRVHAGGGRRTLSATEASRVVDAAPPFCGPFAELADGAPATSFGCEVDGYGYLFTESGRLFRIEDGVNRLVDPTSYQDRSGRSGPVVELHALPDRIWVGIVTSPGDIVQYSSITETSSP